MRRNIRLTAIIMAVILTLSSLTAFAAGGSRTLEAVYGIQLVLNGEQAVLTDSRGNAADPFTVDGTTYVPLKALVDLFSGGKTTVGWDQATDTAYIGSLAKPGNAELYAAAMRDSMTIEDDEMFPLVEISEDSELCSWNEDGQVLMLTHHSYPGSYIAGEEYTLKYGSVWTFTDQEIIRWYEDNKDGVTDWVLRFEQLIGLPEGSAYTHFSAMWVDPDDIIRPGYAWELSDTESAASFVKTPSDEYKAWFDSNIIGSYYDSAYPWTRLGYTYDWAAGSGEYGLSEFLVRKDAVTQVEFTLSTDEFVAWLETQ